VIIRPTVVAPVPRVAPAPRPFRVAPPRPLVQSVDGRLRGAYRLADTALELYELYVGEDAETDFDAAPAATSATLPFDYALTVGHTYRVCVRLRNRFGLVSQNRNITTFIVNAGGTTDGNPPTAPAFVLEPAAGGKVTVHGWYYPGPDGDDAADVFALWLTTDGSTPDPADAETDTATMSDGDAVARYSYTSGALGDGTTVKILLRSRRSGTPDVDSTNTAILAVATEENGPTTPASAGAHLGSSVEVDR
jgi:hypothetical protein